MATNRSPRIYTAYGNLTIPPLDISSFTPDSIPDGPSILLVCTDPAILLLNMRRVELLEKELFFLKKIIIIDSRTVVMLLGHYYTKLSLYSLFIEIWDTQNKLVLGYLVTNSQIQICVSLYQFKGSPSTTSFLFCCPIIAECQSFLYSHFLSYQDSN